ncbi:outer membrane lipoprotein SlyB [Roseateles sp. YR242]|uniref:glycine zipper 2TM domain-containing protein n=1 Tax=Roseateles sp. YR242 TaxID=1855305 RepID=UPI0008BA6CD6|nr:glycine zipper 2TM domain-containing protein [Roseateles sp. YR242]SEK94272.1 outer membrane lipoprotein SlyB [Roseateles sp. YR242]
MKKLLIVSMVALLAACQTSNPDVIQRGDAQRLSQVQDATLLSARPVTVDGSQSGAGALTGAIAGGVAGGSVGGRRDGLVVGVLGAVAGAALGNAVERSATKEDAVELLLQMRNGERRAIVQAKGAETWQPGEPVILVTTGGKTRVMRAPATTAPQSQQQQYQPQSQQPQYQQPQYRQQ